MNHEFAFWCAITTLLAIVAVAGISPLLWDSAGYVSEILGCAADLTSCPTK